MPALIQRFREHRLIRCAKLEAIMHRGAASATVAGDVALLPDGIVQVSQMRHLTETVGEDRSGVLIKTPDAPPTVNLQWFASWLEGMTTRIDDAPSRGLVMAARPVTGEVGTGDRAVEISVPSITLRWWKDRKIDVLAISVANELGVTLTITEPSATPSARPSIGSPARRGSPGRLVDPALLTGTLNWQLASLVGTMDSQ